METPRVLILAGPNGAGKTTFAKEYLPREAGLRDFINADLIAAGLSPFDPSKAALQAGRLMLEEIERRIEAKSSFAFETTLSGRSYAQDIPRWQQSGYRVNLIFLELPSVELALARVTGRVRHGGHAIPEATVRRRFITGRKNFETLYKPLVDSWILYDNSDIPPIQVDQGGKP